jgi:RNA polymerase sigma-70 factor (ECF subfamily)
MPEDDALVVRARHSREAFAILFDEYYPRVQRYCCLRLGHRHTSEDATSEVFLQVARSIKTFAGESAVDFRRWLFRIASNVVNSQFRRIRVRRETACTIEVADASPPVIDHAEDWESVTRAMQELDERSQHVVAMRFLEQQSYEEIAEGLEMTPGAVRTAVSRALSELRRLLGARWPGSGEVPVQSVRSESVP